MQPKYTLDELARVRAALLRLLSGDIMRPDLGVCGNLHCMLERDPGGYSFVQVAAVGWPHATYGDDYYGYFVPHVDSYGLWEGVNLEMRKDLIQYLLGAVTRFENEVKEADDAE